MSKHQIILVSCPDRDTAAGIAGALIERELAACANLVEKVTSIYRWQGEIRQDAEALLIIKTRAARFRDVERCVLELHPYEVPEIIACDISAGNLPYLDWIDESTQ